ncbi:HAD-IIA family hydrolase [Haladaptatus sp. GCM10025707]|uniref:HAD-IIA family hydrolase n=1 Tax=unclassified Haladaptatus TaxID=2622732 RepID=UPI0023E8625D|nr:HAD-IIA family hydrolase [Haladaptatus sp. QDMS2]
MLATRYDAFCFDLDGVVYVGDEPVRGAVESIARLRECDTPVRFVTNNSRSTREEIAARLRDLGVEASTDEVFTAASATAQYLQAEGVESAYVLAPEGFKTEIRRVGIAVTDAPADAVVVGLDRTVTYDDIAQAARQILDHDARFVAANEDGSYPTPRGLEPGTGALVAAIRATVGRDPVVVGKPHATLFEQALSGLSGQIAMVGDSPDADIAGARAAGIDGILVTAHARETANGPAPDETITDLRALFE